ncbi:MAG: ROK family protein [Planctomycetota bacterium]|nr:ROK family protein [Planctomycetota bacterium]
MPPAKPFVGVDLGGTNIQFGVVSHDLKLIGEAKRKTKAEEKLEGVLGRIEAGIAEACADAGVSPGAIGGVGIGAPGAVDPTRGLVLEAVNLRWDNVPLADLLAKRLKTKVFLDNDVNVAVFGENKLGAGKNARDLLGVWLGTGVGGGLILNGALYYGHFWTAGEIGHTILLPNMPRGVRTLEQHCSRTAIVERLAALLRSNQKSRLTAEIGDDYTKIRSRTLARHYHEGDREDALVIEVADAAADLLGQAIGSVVTLLSLPRVVLGGGLTEALGMPFVERVQTVAREVAFPDACKKVEVVPSMLEDTAGVYGAAMIAMERAGVLK